MDYQKLETERLNFRKFKETDLAFLIELLTDESVCEYLPGNGSYTVEICSKYIQYFMLAHTKDRNNLIYLVSRKDTLKPIGYCGIQKVNEFEKYEIFYAYIPKSWGNGFASESSLRMKELAKEIKLNEIIGLADIRNVPSQRVLEKTGLQKQKQLHLWGLDLYYYELKL